MNEEFELKGPVIIYLEGGWGGGGEREKSRGVKTISYWREGEG